MPLVASCVAVATPRLRHAVLLKNRLSFGMPTRGFRAVFIVAVFCFLAFVLVLPAAACASPRVARAGATDVFAVAGGALDAVRSLLRPRKAATLPVPRCAAGLCVAGGASLFAGLLVDEALFRALRFAPRATAAAAADIAGRVGVACPAVCADTILGVTPPVAIEVALAARAGLPSWCSCIAPGSALSRLASAVACNHLIAVLPP